MAQNRAAHNGQVGVAPHEVVGELLHEVQQLPERGSVDLHGGVLPVEDDAVLVVVDVGAVLEEPVLLVDGHRYDPQILPCGVVYPPRVPLVLPAEQTLGIPPLGCRLRCGDGLGVLLRLGEVNGDVQLPVPGGDLPLHVPRDAVPPYVVRVLAEVIKPVRRRPRVLLIPVAERPDDLSGPRRQTPHQLRVKEIAAGHVVVDQPPRRRIVQQLPQDVLQRPLPRLLRLLPCL